MDLVLKHESKLKRLGKVLMKTYFIRWHSVSWSCVENMRKRLDRGTNDTRDFRSDASDTPQHRVSDSNRNSLQQVPEHSFLFTSPTQ